MPDSAPGPRRRRALWALSALAYVGALLALPAAAPGVDADRVRAQMDQIRARLPRPIEPLPTPHAHAAPALDMARNPFSPR